MFRLDLTLPTIEENLALDEALLLEAEAGGPEVLRFWEQPTPAVVLGCNGAVEAEVDAPACRADGVPIRRRCSGGGTVVLARGCRNFSLVLSHERRPELRGVSESYRVILGRIAAALGAGVRCAGTSDLAVAGRKVSGNAQRRLSRCLLHHGTLLYGLDRRLMSRYLREPLRRPQYRGLRRHDEFTSDLTGPPDRAADVVAPAFDARAPLTDWPRERTAALVVEKYAAAEWIFRR
jgi:lipoate-protein ligase A